MIFASVNISFNMYVHAGRFVFVLVFCIYPLDPRRPARPVISMSTHREGCTRCVVLVCIHRQGALMRTVYPIPLYLPTSSPHLLHPVYSITPHLGLTSVLPAIISRLHRVTQAP